VAAHPRRVYPASERYLRRAFRGLGVPMEPLVGGVDQSTFETLEASLLALLDVYRAGSRKETRRLIIQAKDHARLAARRTGDAAKRKQNWKWPIG